MLPGGPTKDNRRKSLWIKDTLQKSRKESSYVCVCVVILMLYPRIMVWVRIFLSVYPEWCYWGLYRTNLEVVPEVMISKGILESSLFFYIFIPWLIM